ncbi:hypothetical protein N0V82_005030 [Gnomoniopsis sp. IMI 355080]|nr:hypothetical protein N0V82_005030 [Gnomoniopsis sp. IMI 355080]
MADEDYRPKSPDLNFDEDEPPPQPQPQHQQQQQTQHQQQPLRIDPPTHAQTPYNNWYSNPTPALHSTLHNRSYSYSASAQSPIGPAFGSSYSYKQEPQSATSAFNFSPGFAPPAYQQPQPQQHQQPIFQEPQPFSPTGYQSQAPYSPGYQPVYPLQQQGYGHPNPPVKSEDDGPTIKVKTEEGGASSSSATMPPRRAAPAAAEAPAAVDPSPVKTKFPTARIKRIMQNDEEVGKVAQQTPIAVGKALEMFMIQLVSASAEVAREKNSKRVTPAMLKTVVEADEQWDFLRDIVRKVEPDKEGGGGGGGGKGKSVAKAESEGDDDGDEDEDEEPKPRKRGGGRRKKAAS